MRNHALVVCRDGEVICIGGSNRDGQCEVPPLPFNVRYVCAAAGLLKIYFGLRATVARIRGEKFTRPDVYPADRTHELEFKRRRSSSFRLQPSLLSHI